MTPTPDQYQREGKRRFGTANPERMHVPTWLWMIESDLNPWRARQALGLEDSYEHGSPDWCFDRFGMSQTTLPDGSIVSIAGEHEDFYDPDFCIYNDVIVHRLDGSVEIYGYPKDVFPPTDFHTATLVGEPIILIGSLGYKGERRPGYTPVYRLDTGSFRIEAMPTTGDSPGWLRDHSARLLSSGTGIEVTGGKLEVEGDCGEETVTNSSNFVLDLATWTWRRTRDGGRFPQLAFARPDLDCLDVHRLHVRDLRPAGLHPRPVARDEYSQREFAFEGVRVVVRDEMRRVLVVVEGSLEDERLKALASALEVELARMMGHPVAATRLV